jgi:hypothetical protein
MVLYQGPKNACVTGLDEYGTTKSGAITKRRDPGSPIQDALSQIRRITSGNLDSKP